MNKPILKNDSLWMTIFIDIVVLLCACYLFGMSSMNISTKILSCGISALVITGFTYFVSHLKESYLKRVLVSLCAIVIYLILPEFQAAPFILLGIDTAYTPMAIKSIYMAAYEIMLMAIILFLFKDQLKLFLVDMKKNHQLYFKRYFKYWFLILGIMMMSNLLISIVNSGQIAGNEEAVRSVFTQAPVYMFFSAVVFAPLVEETIFRLGIRNIVKNDLLFILISGFIFGGLHVFPTMTNVMDLLYLIPYCTPGVVFAYLLVKSNNLFVPAGLHFIHNGVLMSLQFLVLILS